MRKTLQILDQHAETIVKTDVGEVRVRVDQSFYPLDSAGHSIDGPIDSLEEAVDIARDRLLRDNRDRLLLDRDEPSPTFRKRLATLPSDTFGEDVRVWIYDDSAIGGPHDTCENHYHIFDHEESTPEAGRYQLILGDDFYSDDLEELERTLAAWLEDEGHRIPSDMATHTR